MYTEGTRLTLVTERPVNTAISNEKLKKALTAKTVMENVQQRNLKKNMFDPIKHEIGLWEARRYSLFEIC